MSKDSFHLYINSTNNILRKLAGISWGAHAPTLSTKALAVVFFGGRMLLPRLALFYSMRIITDTIKLIQWIIILYNITPPHIRRQTTA